MRHISHHIEYDHSHTIHSEEELTAGVTVASLWWILIGVCTVTLGILTRGGLLGNALAEYSLRCFPFVVAALTIEARNGIKHRKRWGTYLAYVSAAIGGIGCIVMGIVLYSYQLLTPLMFAILCVAAPIIVALYALATTWVVASILRQYRPM